MMTVTLKQISKEAGVSVTTVSRILNGQESGIPIREETRQRVLSVAAALGYRPNLLARGLRGSNSRLIGVIMRDISDPFHAQIVRGVYKTAIERDYRLFLGHVGRQPTSTIDYGSMFEQSHADGILIIGDMEGDEEAIHFLTTQHQYVVGITDRMGQRSYPGVYADSRQGTYLALDYLWQLGHRRITCVSDRSFQDGRWRASVYEQYMHERGLSDYIRIVWAERAIEGGYHAGQNLFAADGMPSAIFAATDMLALGLLQAAFQSHVAVPDQVSIIGFDNIDVSAFAIPPLTTINQMGFDMGQQAIHLLLDMMEQKIETASVEDVMISPELVIRQSCVPKR